MHERAQAIMGGSKRSLSALWHALQLFKSVSTSRVMAGIKSVLHAGCDLHQGVLYHVLVSDVAIFVLKRDVKLQLTNYIMLDSNIRGNSAPRYILAVDYSDNAVLPTP